jgi:hypothetical protein
MQLSSVSIASEPSRLLQQPPAHELLHTFVGQMGDEGCTVLAQWIRIHETGHALRRIGRMLDQDVSGLKPKQSANLKAALIEDTSRCTNKIAVKRLMYQA